MPFKRKINHHTIPYGEEFLVRNALKILASNYIFNCDIKLEYFCLEN